ncbi:hypothetical protein [Actinomadura alba]|uniref:Integral membrane protein n=1 Tax=Actinomadura alba TaxID=406431 RepID=A0ABR7LVH2_9ACTN|nr:hypothetical protein [Actinomadura alba]MBC6468507.1 hypothetical protein [Actinomadura alba]
MHGEATGRMPYEPGTRWLVAAVLVSAAVALALLFLPLSESAGGSSQSGPVPASSASAEPGPVTVTTVRTERRNLVQQEGWAVAMVVSVPVVVCALPLLMTGAVRRWAAAAATTLLWLFVLAGAASIGLFLLPSAILMTVAAVRLRRLGRVTDPAVINQ